jgi:hypothetical protein
MDQLSYSNIWRLLLWSSVDLQVAEALRQAAISAEIAGRCLERLFNSSPHHCENGLAAQYMDCA